MRPEQREETLGDRLMAAIGFDAIRFSQPRNTMQTAGIPDRRYYCPSERLAVWWEAKREKGGRQSPAQRWFQKLVTACGEEYVVGPLEALENWLIEKELAARLPSGALYIRRERKDT